MAKSDSCQIITMVIPSSGLIPHTNNLCRLVVHKSFNARYVSALPKKAHLYNTSTLCIVKEPKKKTKGRSYTRKHIVACRTPYLVLSKYFQRKRKKSMMCANRNIK